MAAFFLPMDIEIRKVKIKDLTHFANIRETEKNCRQCPRYGNSWSCPPEVPNIYKYTWKYKYAYLIVEKVEYPEKLCKGDFPTLFAEREKYYDGFRRELQLKLLEAEKKYPGTYSVSTCLICDQCARSEGKPCRHPESMRYSMTTLGFDFSKLMKEYFDIELSWSGDSLSTYDYIVAALLEP